MSSLEPNDIRTRKEQIVEAILAALRAEFENSVETPNAKVFFALPSIHAGSSIHNLSLILTYRGERQDEALLQESMVATTFDLTVFLQWNPEAPTDRTGFDLMQISGRIVRVLHADAQWGGLAHDTFMRDEQLEPFGPDGVAIAQMTRSFEVRFKHDYGDPFAYGDPQLDDGIPFVSDAEPPGGEEP